MSLQRTIEDVENERAHQEARWGVVNDDRNTLDDWLTYILRYVTRAHTANDPATVRRRLVQIAALAVAAVESFDRNRGFPEAVGAPCA
jgi:hypothetical protein